MDAAARCNNIVKFQALICCATHQDELDSALSASSKAGKFEAAALLLAHGANPARSSLRLAVTMGHLSLVQLFLHVSVLDDAEREVLLGIAAKANRPQLMSVLGHRSWPFSASDGPWCGLDREIGRELCKARCVRMGWVWDRAAQQPVAKRAALKLISGVSAEQQLISEVSFLKRVAARDEAKKLFCTPLSYSLLCFDSVDTLPMPIPSSPWLGLAFPLGQTDLQCYLFGTTPGSVTGVSRRQRLALALQAAKSVAVLHSSELGFAWLDVKLQNWIVFVGDGDGDGDGACDGDGGLAVIRATDLGGVLPLGSLAPVETVQFTARYASPSLARALAAQQPLRVSPSCDLWALCLCLTAILDATKKDFFRSLEAAFGLEHSADFLGCKFLLRDQAELTAQVAVLVRAALSGQVREALIDGLVALLQDSAQQAVLDQAITELDQELNSKQEGGGGGIEGSRAKAANTAMTNN